MYPRRQTWIGLSAPKTDIFDLINFSKWSHNCCPTKSEPVKAATIGVSNGHKYTYHGNHSRDAPPGGCCCVSSVPNGCIEMAVDGEGIYTMPSIKFLFVFGLL